MRSVIFTFTEGFFFLLDSELYLKWNSGNCRKIQVTDDHLGKITLVLFIDCSILFSTHIRPLYPIHSLWGYTRCFSFIHIGHVGCFVCLFVCYCWFVVGLWSCFVLGWEHRLDAFTLFFSLWFYLINSLLFKLTTEVDTCLET